MCLVPQHIFCRSLNKPSSTMTPNETSYKKDNQFNERDTAAFLHASSETSLTLQT